MLRTTIYWFRRDLRISDNPALTEAAAYGRVLPIFIFDPAQEIGAASRWWLHQSLTALNRQLGGALRLFIGDPQEILPALAKKHCIEQIFWNRVLEPQQIRSDTTLKKQLQAAGVEVRSFNGTHLWEPWEVLKLDGTPYRVFTPFYKTCLTLSPPHPPSPAPPHVEWDEGYFGGVPLEQLGLLPDVRWDIKLEPHWKHGEAAALDQLNLFLETGLHGYKTGRDFPARANVSRLSPYLHWGELSPHQAWHAVGNTGEDAVHFRRQLVWREFSYYLLYHFPDLREQNFNRKFDRFAWNADPERLLKWQQGFTGIPFVDAGMRELWQTGSMHNRVRMVVASFLTKNLLQHWHHGRDWFADALVDADLANNCAGWQWVAGCGADAAPYFRIFNPVSQGQKFDPDGSYTRRFVPELAGLPTPYLFNPWEAPDDLLRQSGVTLGETYPLPIVDLKNSRQRALDTYRVL
ncbi:MAG: deoxyribodipyrimidine photo-lyase [Pontiellaceae bacterium]|nr:deoxyribodipyrimidine photo-lyase [Pontiellaceae bacterium]